MNFLESAIRKNKRNIKRIMGSIDIDAPTTHSFEGKACRQAMMKSMKGYGVTYQEALNRMTELMKTIDKNISIDIRKLDKFKDNVNL